MSEAEIVITTRKKTMALLCSGLRGKPFYHSSSPFLTEQLLITFSKHYYDETVGVGARVKIFFES